jgi:hypothetical protein
MPEPADLYFKVGDTLPAVEATLRGNDGEPVNLAGITSVEFRLFTTAFVEVLVGTASVITAASGIVRYTWAEDDLDTPGEFLADWRVTYGDGSVETFQNDGYIRIRVLRTSEAA